MRLSVFPPSSPFSSPYSQRSSSSPSSRVFYRKDGFTVSKLGPKDFLGRGQNKIAFSYLYQCELDGCFQVVGLQPKGHSANGFIAKDESWPKDHLNEFLHSKVASELGVGQRLYYAVQHHDQTFEFFVEKCRPLDSLQASYERSIPAVFLYCFTALQHIVHLYDHGLLHNDIKPANLGLSDNNNSSRLPHVVFLDLGSAKSPETYVHEGFDPRYRSKFTLALDPLQIQIEMLSRSLVEILTGKIPDSLISAQSFTDMVQSCADSSSYTEADQFLLDFMKTELDKLLCINPGRNVGIDDSSVENMNQTRDKLRSLLKQVEESPLLQQAKDAYLVYRTAWANQRFRSRLGQAGPTRSSLRKRSRDI